MINFNEFIFELLKNNITDTVQVILFTKNIKSRKNLGDI